VCVPAKVVGIATAGTHQEFRMAGLLQKEPKNAFTPGLPSSRAQLFTARVRHSVPEQSISPGAERTVKKTSRDPFHCREYALSPGDVRPQAFPSTVSSKFCTYSKSFFFSSPKQNGSIVNRSSAALFRTSTNPGKMMLL